MRPLSIIKILYTISMPKGEKLHCYDTDIYMFQSNSKWEPNCLHF